MDRQPKTYDFTCEACGKNRFEDRGDYYRCAVCGTNKPKDNQDND